MTPIMPEALRINWGKCFSTPGTVPGCWNTNLFDASRTSRCGLLKCTKIPGSCDDCGCAWLFGNGAEGVCWILPREIDTDDGHDPTIPPRVMTDQRGQIFPPIALPPILCVSNDTHGRFPYEFPFVLNSFPLLCLRSPRRCRTVQLHHKLISRWCNETAPSSKVLPARIRQSPVILSLRNPGCSLRHPTAGT